MCGIAGQVTLTPDGSVDLQTVRAMTKLLSHRGPDGDGEYIARNGAAVLGHRRLSIIDLKTVVLPYDHNDTASFSVGLLGVATISGGGGIYFPRVLDNRRYWMILAQTSNREGTSSVFSPSADLFIRNGCAEIVPGARLAESFSVLNCRLTPRLTVVTVSPSVDIPVALLGVMTLPPGQPVKVFRERLYRFTGPSSLDLETGQAHFSSTFDLFVGAEGRSDIVRFVAESKASRYFSIHNRMIEADKVSRLVFDDNDSTTELELQSGYPIRSTDLVRGRRYMVRAARSWDPDDLISQNFIAGRFGGEPGLIIGEDGHLTVTEAVSKHFKVTAYPPRLVAKVGDVKFTVNGIKERLRVNAVILPGSADRCGTRVLTGRLHQLALIGSSGTPVASTNFTFHFDGHCSPATLTFPQGTIGLDCSL